MAEKPTDLNQSLRRETCEGPVKADQLQMPQFTIHEYLRSRRRRGAGACAEESLTRHIGYAEFEHRPKTGEQRERRSLDDSGVREKPLLLAFQQRWFSGSVVRAARCRCRRGKTMAVLRHTSVAWHRQQGRHAVSVFVLSWVGYIKNHRLFIGGAANKNDPRSTTDFGLRRVDPQREHLERRYIS